MLKLRRLPTDPERLLRRLDVLEKWTTAGEIEPWRAVVLAEWARLAKDRTDDPAPTAREHREMFLDKVLLGIMRDQADGPWAVYVDQARGEAAAAHLRDGLAALDLASSPAPEPAPDAKDLIMTEPLFPDHKWDVAISYAGEDAGIVDPIVKGLRLAGLRVFYANWDETRAYLWGKDLVTELPRIYQEEAAYCIVFVSEAYARSVWTRLELRNSLARALENEEYVKPIRLDDAKLAGLSSTVSYLDARPGHLYSDPSRLVPLMLHAISCRGQFKPIPLRPEATSSALTLEEYFETALPAMLRWRGESATSVGGTVLYVLTGAEAGVWLLRLCPPEATVKRILPEDDMNALSLPRHLEIKITPTEMTKMLTGQFDARKALIEGNVELKGDLTLLKPVGAIFS
jgi:hypothetical protein